MDPRIYVPAYLERLYIQEHPGLTEGARELVREQIAAEPERYAANMHAQALLSYSRVHGELADGLLRMEGLPDDEFERGRGELFSRAREQLANIIGWLHILEALAQGSIFAARYRSAAN